jgi:antitoxin (DNA-binding transcriptional repressor) of toxin-antitoxin stability system
MTKTISISEVQNSVQTLIALTKNGDEIVLEENGEAIAKITPIAKPERKERILGLGKNGYFMSDDFDDELPDEFWGFDKEL